MPVWLQLVCAVSAGLVSWLLGIALVPYLTKQRFFHPEQRRPDTEDSDTLTREERRPTMGGLLLLAGILFALVLSGTLFLQFSGFDRTSAAFPEQLRKLQGAGIYTAILCGIGILNDVLLVRGRYNPTLWAYILLPLVFMAAMGCIDLLAYTEAEQIAYRWLLLLPFAACFCFVWEYDMERKTDGALITVNAVELLLLTILLLRKMYYIPSLLTLSGAGACLGSMVWCLHPAKCRLGRTGQYLLGGLLPSVCMACGMYKELALFMAVFFLQQLYRLRKRENKYLTDGMAESGISPHGILAILAGLAAFCGIMALLLK